ncbi:MAG: CBS domain-containing protein [Planctomycetota bacterium]
MKAIKVARVPAPTVPAETMIKAAIPNMKIDSGCSLGVVEEGRLVGTLSKDDILHRVVGGGLDPATTPVREVMTQPPLAVDVNTEMEEALKLMTANRQCFLPVIGAEGSVEGWLAVCHLLEENVEQLSEQLDTFAAMLGADGPGG